MTAVEFYHKEIIKALGDKLDKDLLVKIWNLNQEAKVMHRQQVETIVLDLLHHELGHDNTARFLTEQIESGELDLLEGYTSFMCAMSDEDRCDKQCYTCMMDQKLDEKYIKNKNHEKDF